MGKLLKIAGVFEYDKNGTVYKGNIDIMKFAATDDKWSREPGWNNLQCGDWGEIMKKHAAA